VNGENRQSDIASIASATQLREGALTNAVDDLSAAEILEGLPQQLHEIIVRHVAERPDRPALAENGGTWSYRDFSDAVDVVSADLRRLAVRPADRVVIASENSVPLAAFVFACSRSSQTRA
jgi:long-chain acyl-CoA synthetase